MTNHGNLSKYNREAFMKFFRTTEKLNEVTPDDRVEIFRTVVLGSSDFTIDLLNEILRNYSIEHLEVIDLNHGNVRDSSLRYASFRMTRMLEILLNFVRNDR